MSKAKFLAFLALIVLSSCHQQLKEERDIEETKGNEKEVLLIGTFHYHNPGADVAKTKSFDILSESAQSELEHIASKIKTYNPTKIFVEWNYDEQQKLDSLYNLYQEENYFTNDSLSNFYLKNEIFQLAFRVAKANKLTKVHAIDYHTSFPFEDVMKAMEAAGQTELKAELEKTIAQMTAEFDEKINSGASLLDMTYSQNNPESRKLSNHLHNNLMLRAGDTDDFSGPLLTSEWFKRNLYMWSLVKKYATNTDERVMVLAGSSHVAMFDLFIREDDSWKVVELKDIIK